MDLLADTDFPDVRNLSIIQSQEGSALLIPRENDCIRIYVQLSEADLVDPQTGRVDKDRTSVQKILEIAQKIMKPYRITAVGEPEWWTTYISEFPALYSYIICRPLTAGQSDRGLQRSIRRTIGYSSPEMHATRILRRVVSSVNFIDDVVVVACI